MIFNQTKRSIIAEEKRFCKTPLSKTIGLMFSRALKNKGLVFVFDKETKINLHMLFVFFPIDVLFLNSDKEIVEIKENLKPFCFYSPKNKARYAIELCKNSIKSSKTMIMDRIEF